jgi:dipeptidase
MKRQTAVEWLAEQMMHPSNYNPYIEQAKEIEEQQQGYSEEEVEDLIYKVCGTVARLQGITLNGNYIHSAYKQYKKK